MTGFTIEYSFDLRTVWIIPKDGILLDDMDFLMKHLKKNGFKYWLPADDTGAYILSKDKPTKS